MESLSYFYDIENPRTSVGRLATIENSIHHSLLLNKESSNRYGCLMHSCIWITAIGIVVIIIVIILLVMKKLA